MTGTRDKGKEYKAALKTKKSETPKSDIQKSIIDALIRERNQIYSYGGPVGATGATGPGPSSYSSPPVIEKTIKPKGQ